MAVLNVKVTYDDGSCVDVKITPAAQVAFEREYGMGLNKASNDMRNEYLYFLAWKATQLDGAECQDFESFMGSIEDVSINKQERENPTVPEAESGT